MVFSIYGSRGRRCAISGNGSVAKHGCYWLAGWEDEKRAGHSVMTIVVPDLSSEIKRLSSLGLHVVNEAEGDFGSVAQLFDPEGNQINLSEPPTN